MEFRVTNFFPDFFLYFAAKIMHKPITAKKNYINPKQAILLCIVFSLALCGCRKNNPIEHIEEKYTGIAETDINGEIIKDDSLDWQPRCMSDSGGPISIPDSSCFAPAFPNPTDRYTTLQFSIPTTARVKITMKNKPSGTSAKIVYDTLPAGVFKYHYDFASDSVQNKNGIYRFYFEFSLPENGTIFKKSFGDVQLIK
jgi:hypothetical protein